MPVFILFEVLVKVLAGNRTIRVGIAETGVQLFYMFLDSSGPSEYSVIIPGHRPEDIKNAVLRAFLLTESEIDPARERLAAAITAICYSAAAISTIGLTNLGPMYLANYLRQCRQLAQLAEKIMPARKSIQWS